MPDYLSPTTQASIEEDIAFLEQEEERVYIQGKKRKFGDTEDDTSVNPKEIASRKDFDVASPINLEDIEAIEKGIEPQQRSEDGIDDMDIASNFFNLEEEEDEVIDEPPTQNISAYLTSTECPNHDLSDSDLSDIPVTDASFIEVDRLNRLKSF